MSTAHFQPIFDRLREHETELEKMFADAGVKQKEDNMVKATMTAYKAVYEADDAPLVKFANMKASESNAKTMNAAFKLMDSFSSTRAFETDEIKAKGAEKGFDEGESLFLYNLAKYAKALDNLRSQKDKMIEIIIADA